MLDLVNCGGCITIYARRIQAKNFMSIPKETDNVIEFKQAILAREISGPEEPSFMWRNECIYV